MPASSDAHGGSSARPADAGFSPPLRRDADRVVFVAVFFSSVLNAWYPFSPQLLPHGAPAPIENEPARQRTL